MTIGDSQTEHLLARIEGGHRDSRPRLLERHRQRLRALIARRLNAALGDFLNRRPDVSTLALRESGERRGVSVTLKRRTVGLTSRRSARANLASVAA